MVLGRKKQLRMSSINLSDTYLIRDLELWADGATKNCVTNGVLVHYGLFTHDEYGTRINDVGRRLLELAEVFDMMPNADNDRLVYTDHGDVRVRCNHSAGEDPDDVIAEALQEVAVALEAKRRMKENDEYSDVSIEDRAVFERSVL